MRRLVAAFSKALTSQRTPNSVAPVLQRDTNSVFRVVWWYFVLLRGSCSTVTKANDPRNYTNQHEQRIDARCTVLGYSQIVGCADYICIELDALAYLFVRLHSQGFTVASIFWGLWLFPFGILVIRGLPIRMETRFW